MVLTLTFIELFLYYNFPSSFTELLKIAENVPKRSEFHIKYVFKIFFCVLAVIDIYYISTFNCDLKETYAYIHGITPVKH